MTGHAVEKAPIIDTYSDGIDHIEICGPNVRLVYFTWDGDEKVIVAKIIRPIEGLSMGFHPLLDQAMAREREKRAARSACVLSTAH